MDSEEVMNDDASRKAQGRVGRKMPPDRIHKICFSRPDASVIARYKALPDVTTTVSDLLDDYGIAGVVAGSHLKPLIPGKVLVGTAVTLRSIPERKTPTQGVFDKEPIKMSTREVYTLSEPGDVLVADFGGNPDVSNMGGQSALIGKTAGVAGAIVHGAVRDVPTIRALDFPVWSTGVTPITGKFRMEAMEINGPVSMHGIVIYPGDLIVADDSGVCVIPAENVLRLIAEAERICAAENQIRDLIRSKAPKTA